MYRKDPLISGEIYHIFSKSIAGFKIFNKDSEYLRMMATTRYYQMEDTRVKFSRFIKSENGENSFSACLHNDCLGKDRLVEIIAYCIMPTHLHLILKQLKDKGISTFMNNILNSYSRYFNTKHNRKGPLWESRFKNVLVRTNEQLLHLTRYIHLNPVTAYLVNKPQLWQASSYNEYLLNIDSKNKICKYDDVLDINPDSYRKFVEDRASYQRDLKEIKDLILE